MKKSLSCALILAIAAPLGAQVPYGTIPDWFSVEDSYYGTGSSVADINGDGFPDLAVSNGNDISESPNLVYFSVNGIMPDTAGWVSANLEYSGHCELADYDADGFPELAVANFISDSLWNPNVINIYDNINGSLETEPSWVSSDSNYSFRLAWGDIDSDGDLDLALATGEPYHEYLQPNLVYFNDNGILQDEPGWVSADSDACLDIRWVDIDLDGDLDLAVCESVGPVKIYFNHGDSLATFPGWQSADEDNFNSFDFADLNGDGFPEMAVATNIQLSGSGFFKIYLNENGTLEAQPYWQSASAGYGSEAAFSDIDSDGDFDLITGRWRGLVYIYLNNNGQFAEYPNWNSSGSYRSFIENIVFGDFNGGAEREYVETFEAAGQRLIYLSRRQLAAIDSVKVDGAVLELHSYCVNLWDGWVSLGVDPVDSASVFYRYSVSKDMAVTNWDRETYIFYNNSPGFIPGDVNDSGSVNGQDVVFLVNYLKGGKAPKPRLAADVDGNCQIDEMDVARLIDYLEGGIAPIVGDCD